MTRIADNLACIRQEIAAAAQRSGRPAEAVTLVAVTKYAGDEAVRVLMKEGCRDLGESRPQELWRKAEALARAEAGRSELRWHLIGHLQRNKVTRTLPVAWLIHSVDSLRLLAAIDEAAAGLPSAARVLLEVNVSGETAKHGLAPEEVEPLLARLPEFPRVEVLGLMAMARLEGGRDASRADFARLRELRDRLVPLAPAGVSLAELSMGMSGDFDVAIEEGATIVRVGSRLFEGAYD